MSALSLLGLARRAGQVQLGLGRAREALRARRAVLLVVADDASPDQVEKVRKIAVHAGVPVRTLGDRAALGAALGSSPVTAVVVTQASFADAILRDRDTVEYELHTGVE